MDASGHASEGLGESYDFVQHSHQGQGQPDPGPSGKALDALSSTWSRSPPLSSVSYHSQPADVSDDVSVHSSVSQSDHRHHYQPRQPDRYREQDFARDTTPNAYHPHSQYPDQVHSTRYAEQRSRTGFYDTGASESLARPPKGWDQQRGQPRQQRGQPRHQAREELEHFSLRDHASFARRSHQDQTRDAYQQQHSEGQQHVHDQPVNRQADKMEQLARKQERMLTDMRDYYDTEVARLRSLLAEKEQASHIDQEQPQQVLHLRSLLATEAQKLQSMRTHLQEVEGHCAELQTDNEQLSKELMLSKARLRQLADSSRAGQQAQQQIGQQQTLLQKAEGTALQLQETLDIKMIELGASIAQQKALAEELQQVKFALSQAKTDQSSLLQKAKAAETEQHKSALSRGLLDRGLRQEKKLRQAAETRCTALELRVKELISKLRGAQASSASQKPTVDHKQTVSKLPQGVQARTYAAAKSQHNVHSIDLAWSPQPRSPALGSASASIGAIDSHAKSSASVAEPVSFPSFPLTSSSHSQIRQLSDTSLPPQRTHLHTSSLAPASVPPSVAPSTPRRRSSLTQTSQVSGGRRHFKSPEGRDDESDQSPFASSYITPQEWARREQDVRQKEHNLMELQLEKELLDSKLGKMGATQSRSIAGRKDKQQTLRRLQELRTEISGMKAQIKSLRGK